MKKIFYLNILLALLFITSCENERTIYNDRYSGSILSSTIVNYQMVAEDGNRLWLNYGEVTQRCVSVPVTITNNTNSVFTPKQS